MTKTQWKWGGLAALIGLAIFLLYPSIDWYTMDEAQRDRLEAGRMRPKHLLNLGLDLKGGTHLLLELDVAALPAGADVSDAISRAIEIIRNRIDQFGVAEPLIAKQGDRWIVVQLPGIKNTDRAIGIIGTTALLEFRMACETDACTQAAQKLNELGESPFVKDAGSETMVVSDKAKKLLPEGTSLFRGREDSYLILHDKVPVTGSELDSARVETGQNGLPNVAFKFKPEGAKIFGDLTSANVGKSLAIVLDGVVQSAPVIRGPIRGGSGIIEGTFSMDDARQLAIVLRAGALPAPLRIIEERTVGATLGEDSIRKGLAAAAGGLGMVLLFMLLYYRVSGLFADFAMILNMLFVVALMCYFGATLTLPGLAGFALSVGMAIDANVLIFERMREELALGKPARIAVDAGYDKAFSAILDGNVTALVAALFLFQFGTGPIKGFAVTLTLGILCSMFTATVTTRMMYESWLAAGNAKEISI